MMENNLVVTGDQEITMSTRELAEITGKRHNHVMRDVKNLIGESKLILSSYINEQNKTRPMYLLKSSQVGELMMSYVASMSPKTHDRVLSAQKSLIEKYGEKLQLEVNV